MNGLDIDEIHAISEGWTALHFAAFRSQKDEVINLLNEGEDVDVRDRKMCTPLFHLIFADTQIFPLQFGSKKNRKEYRRYHTEHLEIAEYLIKCGANVNALVSSQNLPLLSAVKLMGNFEFVKFLEERGAREEKTSWVKNMLSKLFN